MILTKFKNWMKYQNSGIDNVADTEQLLLIQIGQHRKYETSLDSYFREVLVFWQSLAAMHKALAYFHFFAFIF